MSKFQKGKLYELSFLSWQDISIPEMRLYDCVDPESENIIGRLKLNQTFLVLEKQAKSNYLPFPWNHVKILTNNGVVGYIIFKPSDIKVNKL